MSFLISLFVKLSKIFLIGAIIMLVGVVVSRRKNIFDKLVFFGIVVASSIVAVLLYGNNFQQYLLLIQPLTLVLIIYDLVHEFKPKL